MNFFAEALKKCCLTAKKSTIWQNIPELNSKIGKKMINIMPSQDESSIILLSFVSNKTKFFLQIVEICNEVNDQRYIKFYKT